MKRKMWNLVTLVAAVLLFSETVQADVLLLGIRDTRITMLRAHDVGTAFGPPTDQIDVEVVIQLEDWPGSFGFQLRADSNEPARRAMLDLLRDAFNYDWLVNIDYFIELPKENGVIIRVWLTKPTISGRGRG